jgi:hypothetical protein
VQQNLRQKIRETTKTSTSKTLWVIATDYPESLIDIMGNSLGKIANDEARKLMYSKELNSLEQSEGNI